MPRGVSKNNELKEEKMQYLEFIQQIINRHSTNSFQIKTISITIFSAIVAMYINSQVSYMLYCSIITTLVFWMLDAFYLLRERQFRKLYDDAVDDKVKIYNMNIGKYRVTIIDFIKVMFSKTIVPLYIALLTITVVGVFLCRSL